MGPWCSFIYPYAPLKFKMNKHDHNTSFLCKHLKVQMNNVFSNTTLTERYMYFKVIYSILSKSKEVSAPLNQSPSQKVCKLYNK